MESFAFILAFIVGILTGLVGWDLKRRKEDSLKITSAEAEMLKTLQSINETHNSLVLQVQQAQERLTAIEIRASQSQGRTTQQWTSNIPQAMRNSV